MLIEAAAYAVYYAAAVHVYLMADSSVYHLIANAFFLYALSWLYEKNWRKNLACAMTICFILVLSSVFGVLFSTVAIRPVLRYANIVLKAGLFLRCIVMFALVQFIKQWKAIEEGDYVPWGYWVCILLVLCCSVYFIISWVGTVPALRFAWNAILVVIMNFIIVFLYDSLMVSMRRNNRNILIEEQNQSYAKELELVMESHNSIRMLRHDMKNHLIAVRALIKSENYQQANRYVQQLSAEIEEGQGFCQTGNIAVDSMINYKWQEADRDQIRLETDLQIPVDLPITPFDLSVMLGNLLDNAITAVRKVPVETRYICLKMKLKQNCLYLQVENPFMGKLSVGNGVLLTTKENKREHGLGLQSVKKITAKYGGNIEITGKNNVFNVNIVLFLGLGR